MGYQYQPKDYPTGNPVGTEQGETRASRLPPKPRYSSKSLSGATLAPGLPH